MVKRFVETCYLSLINNEKYLNINEITMFRSPISFYSVWYAPNKEWIFKIY